MKIVALFLAALLLTNARAFSPVSRPPSRNTALMISVDPMVLAGAGMAVVAGGASVLISAKIRELDVQEASTAAPAPAPAATSDATPDLSIPYDAAARLSFEKAGSPGDYAAFKAKFEADAVADVIAKQKAR